MNGTSIAVVYWDRPSGFWDKVTVACNPKCQPVEVTQPALNATVEHLIPGQVYSFSAVSTKDRQVSEPAVTANNLTMGMFKLIC